MLALGHALLRQGYRFIAVTPATHTRIAGLRTRAADLRDVFGWNLPFEPDLLPAEMLNALRDAGALKRTESGLLACTLRFASFGNTVLLHSTWPAPETGAVRFGPDGYRYAALIERVLGETSDLPRNVVELCCNSGAGGILCGNLLGERTLVLFADTNMQALRHARLNAALAGVPRFACQHGKLLDTVRGAIDLVIANAPHGDLATRIVEESLRRLGPGGRLVLCAPAPIVRGCDLLREAIEPLLRRAGATHRYQEIEVDLAGVASGEVERVAAIGLVAQTW